LKIWAHPGPLNVLDSVLEVEDTSELSVEDGGSEDVAISELVELVDELENVLDAVLDVVLNVLVLLKVLLANNASLVAEAIVIDGNNVDCGSNKLVVAFSLLVGVLGSLLSQQ
jgi:hypothetical protein